MAVQLIPESAVSLLMVSLRAKYFITCFCPFFLDAFDSALLVEIIAVIPLKNSYAACSSHFTTSYKPEIIIVKSKSLYSNTGLFSVEPRTSTYRI